jgi:hypothetical protein
MKKKKKKKKSNFDFQLNRGKDDKYGNKMKKKNKNKTTIKTTTLSEQFQKLSSLLHINIRSLTCLNFYCNKTGPVYSSFIGPNLPDSFLSSFMTYHRVWNKSNTTSVNSGAGTAYHSKAHELTDCFWWGSCFFILFCVVFSRFVILLYFYRPLCCHPFPWFAASDLPFDIWWFTLWYLLIYPLVSSDLPFGIFWFTLWYLLIYPLVSSDLPFGIFQLVCPCCELM